MDGIDGVLLVLALLGVAAAGVGLTLWRAERARSAAAQAEAERLTAELASARSAALDATRAGRGRGEELAELRRKLEKARKRAFAAQQEREPLAARVQELESTLADRDRTAGELRARLDGFADERETAAREVVKLRDELASARQAATSARIDPGEHSLLEQRVEAADSEIRRLQPLLRAAEQEASRWRQRERVQRRS
jgi:chromosome segregation ATPase